MGVDLLEGGQQPLAALPVQARDALAQTADGGDQVGTLRLHAADLRVQLLGLGLGAQIDRPHIVALALQPGELGLDLLALGQLLPGIDLGDLEHLIEIAVQALAHPLRGIGQALLGLGDRALGARQQRDLVSGLDSAARAAASSPGRAASSSISARVASLRASSSARWRSLSSPRRAQDSLSSAIVARRRSRASASRARRSVAL